MQQKALIRRSGNLIQVVPDYHLLLSPHLTFTKRKQSGASAASAEYETTHLYLFRDNTLLVPAGLTPRVLKVLRDASVEVSFEDLRARHLPEPDFSRLPVLREGQDEMLLSTITNDWGILEGPTGSGKSFLIRQLCRVWPQANFIITSPFTGIVRQFFTELMEMFSPLEIGYAGGGRHDVNKRIVCAVDKSLMHCNLDKCDVLIYDEVHRAAAPKTAEVLSTIQHARRYGFSASPGGRGDSADLETEAMFGPIIHRSTYQEVQKTGAIVPVRVYRIRTDHIRNVEYSNSTALERNCLWRHEDRNDLVVQAVRWIQSNYGPDLQILIMVKTVEHAVFLGAKLPDFAICYGSMDPDKREMWERWKLLPPGKHPLTASDKARMQDDFAKGKLRRCIATGSSNGVWSTGIDFPHLNAMIRADAQSGSILNTQIPGRVSRKSEGKEYGLLFDFNDLFNSTLKRRAEKRFSGYRKKGWEIQELTLSPASSSVA